MGYAREIQTEYQTNWLHKRRREWIASKGGACESCGSPDRLEVDHIDRATKTMPAAGIWSRRADVRAAELALCQVLCHDCHKAKTASEFTVVYSHGDYGMYNKRGCRCEPCRATNTLRVREQRASRQNRS